jgi:hypothetical protein
VVLGASLLPALPQAAEPDPVSARADTTIVVTGRNPRETRRAVSAFVSQVTRGAGGDDLARFKDPVCPAAFGLKPERNAQIVERIRRVAAAAGVRVDRAGCLPNILVVIAPDKRVLIEGLERRGGSGYFGELPPSKVRALATGPGKAAAWQTYGPALSARDVELFIDPGSDLYTNQTTEPASRLHSAAHPQTYGAVVVIETAAIEGLSVTQVADYAAMRALGGADPQWLAGGEPTDSILGLIDAPAGSPVPLSLTRIDLGFLRGLYESPPDSTPSQRRGIVRNAILRELEPAGGAGGGKHD